MGGWHQPYTSFRVYGNSSMEGCCYLTTPPIVNAHVAPGTEVWLDEWSAYHQVGTLPNVSRHRTVNHSVNFVDSVTRVHTQHIESYWNRVKQKLKRMKRCSRAMLSGYLDEFMWKEHNMAQLEGKLLIIFAGILPCGTLYRKDTFNFLTYLISTINTLLLPNIIMHTSLFCCDSPDFCYLLLSIIMLFTPCTSLIPRPYEGPGTHCLRMCGLYGNQVAGAIDEA